MTSRLAGILKSATQQILVAAPPDDSRIDGHVGLERRLTLHQDEHVEITDLVVDAAARRSGVGRALVTAGEQWAAQHGLHTMVVRSNVVRPESHLFCEGTGYQRTATSHVYHKQAARRRGLPIVVHEANARPGVANRLAARMTTHVFTATPSVRLAHATAIGIPLRPAITGLDRPALRHAARQRFGLRPDRPVLMVTGGSQGARAINAAVSGAAAALRAAGVQVLHITGPQHAVQLPDGDPAGPPYIVIPYVEEMQYGYAAADFAVCLSGAMPCAELAAVGLPAAYVPLPLRGGEQRLNAEPAVAAGGALLIDNAGLDPAWIKATLIPVLTDPGRIAAMSARASAAAAPDADVVLARHVLTAVAERRTLAS